MENKKSILVVSFQSLTKHSAGGMARLGYYLSKELDQRGLLNDFIVHSKGKFDTAFASSPVSWFSRYYLYLINALTKKLKLTPYKSRFLQEKLYDRLCAMRIRDDIKILFTTNAHMKRTFRKARKKGIKIIYIPANPEENYIYDLVTDEQLKLGIEITDAYTYQPRLDYYNTSMRYVDEVIGTYPTVYTSYAASATTAKVSQINGHLMPDFGDIQVAKKNSHKDVYKVGYLGQTVVLKGLHYLLEAWEKIMKEQPGAKAELYVAGLINPELKEYINDRFKNLRNVHYYGYLTDVQEFIRDKDVFVVPSLIDGGPYTALEAAYYGLPVIITENCGSSELLGREESGCWIIPIKDSEAIKERILWAEQHREEALLKGSYAKKNLDQYNMNELISRVADHLEGALGKPEDITAENHKAIR
jgi:glycosyltransferase involved in cell wall biosynthesis